MPAEGNLSDVARFARGPRGVSMWAANRPTVCWISNMKRWTAFFAAAPASLASGLQGDVVLRKSFALVALLIVLLPWPCEARVVRFVVAQKRAFADGKAFGSAGPYERLDGTAYFEVDPTDALNAMIVNLDKAPRNARGMVEFSAPFCILKPVDMARGNHKILYAINNRGNKQALGYFNFAPAGAGINNPLTATDAGDGFLMRLGYTVVDAGWQGDVARGANRLSPQFPIATQPDGSPIVAAVRIEYSDRTIRREGAFTLNLEGSP